MSGNVMDTDEAPLGAGTVREVGSDRPFLLRGPLAWEVTKGRVDVFAVRVEDGAPAGSRTHLFRVERGGWLFGSDDGDRAFGLLAVGVAGTRLVEYGHAELEARPDTLVEALDGWVDQLCAAAWNEPLPPGTAEFAAGEVEPADGAAIRSRDEVTWVRHETGASLLYGVEGMKVNGVGFTPVSRRAWLTPGAGSRIRALATRDIVRGGDAAWDGLDRLNGLVLDFVRRRAEATLAAERERMRRKAAAGRRAFGDACSDLAGSLNRSAPLARITALDGGGAATGDAVVAACQMVGAALGLPIRFPRGDDLNEATDRLGAVARASRLRTRRVVLREEWWRGEAGPMLGFMDNGARPVALIPAQGGGYLMRDPAAGTETRLDGESAAELDPVAHTFYRSLPDTVLGMREVLAFGLRGCGKDLWMVVGLGTIAALLSLVTPIATGIIFNDVIPGAARSQLLQMTLMLVVIAVAHAMFSVVNSIALIRVETRMGNATQAAVWDRLLGLPIPFFRPYSAGELATRAMGIDSIRQVLSGATITAMLGGAFSLVHFGLLFHYSKTLAWWSAGLIALAVCITALGTWLQLGAQRASTHVQSKLAGTVLQFLGSITKLRVAGAEGHAFALWARSFGKQRQHQFRMRTVANGVASFNAGFPVASYLVIYAVAVPLLAPAGELRTGDFLAFMSSFGTCLTGLLGACTALLGTLAVVPIYEQARPILESLPEVDLDKSDPGVLRGEVELQHVAFRYHRDGPPVLRDVSMRIHPGEFVAFVGPSGSGKSTLLRILLGFEQQESGAVYFDGQELSGLDVQAVRRQIGVVLQNGRLSTGDVFTNIVGSTTATVEQAWEAARMAGFDADVKAMPMGMHTVISEGGGTLSGGQRQRLMIARALVKRPRILFFDEATSALDNRTQAIVSASLDQLNATRVVVAHRLSTVVNADRIFVIEAGRIVQCGSYAELMAVEGPFAELARRQLA
jgi:NHLM bacteriocin system ABC transporter ATP-binding protein